MATFRGLRRTVAIFSPSVIHRQLSRTTCLNAAAWNKDWCPGPVPKTQKEMEAAAKKYGLQVEDYKPKPDDGFGLGDYPDLPLIGAASRSDFEHYDYPALKRNYGEPLHEMFDSTTGARWNPQDREQIGYIPYWKQFVMTSSIVLFIAGLMYFIPLKYINPVMPQQKKYGWYTDKANAKTHYTFEPAQ